MMYKDHKLNDFNLLFMLQKNAKCFSIQKRGECSYSGTSLNYIQF
jgi:hypothetical protein